MPSQSRNPATRAISGLLAAVLASQCAHTATGVPGVDLKLGRGAGLPLNLGLALGSAHTVGISGFGWLVNGNATQGESLDQLPQQVALAYATGARLLRIDLVWSVTEPTPGVYDFSTYDTWIPLLLKTGFRVLLILDYTHSAYNGGGSPSTPEGVAAFAAWAGAAAGHYAGKGIIWEIYNEPLNFWAAPNGTNPQPVPGNTPPALGSGACLMYVGHGGAPASWQDPWCQAVFGWYADLAIATSKAIKAVDAHNFVLGPAASERAWYFDSNQSFLEEIFARGVLEHLDAVTVHAYTTGPGRLWDPEEGLPAYARTRALIERYKPPGKNILLVDGEHGFFTSCAEEAWAGEGWPWAGATAQRVTRTPCVAGPTIRMCARVGSAATQCRPCSWRGCY